MTISIATRGGDCVFVVGSPRILSLMSLYFHRVHGTEEEGGSSESQCAEVGRDAVCFRASETIAVSNVWEALALALDVEFGEMRWGERRGEKMAW